MTGFNEKKIHKYLFDGTTLTAKKWNDREESGNFWENNEVCTKKDFFFPILFGIFRTLHRM